jgi:hypothetical protein
MTKPMNQMTTVEKSAYPCDVDDNCTFDANCYEFCPVHNAQCDTCGCYFEKEDADDCRSNCGCNRDWEMGY